MSLQFDVRDLLLNLSKQRRPCTHRRFLERYFSPLDGDRTVNVVQFNRRPA